LFAYCSKACRGTDDLVDHPRVDRCPIGRDLNRRRAVPKGAGEELACSVGIAAFGNQNVDDLTMLIDSAVELSPAPGDLHIGLVDEPPIAGGVPGRTGGVDELRRERLHPPVDGHMVDLDARSASSSSTSR
jgi:hypothetical protein